MSRNSLLEAGAKSEGAVTATGLEPRTTQFLNNHLVLSVTKGNLSKTTTHFTDQQALPNTSGNELYKRFLFQLV